MLRVGRQITVTITDEQVALLNLLAKERGTSFAAAVRTALAQGLGDVTPKSPRKGGKK